MTAAEFLAELSPVCRDLKRRADILAHPSLNGIEVVEYEFRESDPHPHILVVHFLKPLPDPAGPDGAFGLTTNPELVKIAGGTRIVDLRVLGVKRVGERLEIAVDQAGDFSAYWLLLGWQRQPDGAWLQVIPALEQHFSKAPVNFRVSCPVDFDCREEVVCPPEPRQEPLIDYLAKDYASFRQLLLDSLPQLNPDWQERNPADLGMALIELLAYTGDHLSYFQDAVANEMYLDTVRQRLSARRHARLIDYRMHDGRNAWTFVHLATDSNGTVPQGTRLLTKIPVPLANQPAPPPVVISESLTPQAAFASDPALVRAVVFETAFPLEVCPENNTIFIHSWGNQECCLPPGAATAYLYTVKLANPRWVRRPFLEAGDFLILEEVKGPATGEAADADPVHRQVVRLVDVQETQDHTYKDRLRDGNLQVWRTGNTALPLLKVTWRQEDALTFPLCLSVRPPGKDPVFHVSVARGNMVLADHGRTMVEEFPQAEPVPPDRPFRLRHSQGPLTMQCQPPQVDYDPVTAALRTPRLELRGTPRQAQPAIALLADFPAHRELWTPVPDLLDSSSFDRHFVVEADDNGRGTVRFGDGEYGREPAGALSFTVTCRVGNGRPGNVGAQALAHIVQPLVAPRWPDITAVLNPLEARDGQDLETIEEVRQLAPAAFRAEQYRAVIEADYTAAALKIPEVAGAVATFRWTGSWHTVFLGVDPRHPGDLITLPGGRTELASGLTRKVKAHIQRYRLAAYDMEIRSARYVPLEIDLEVCAAPDHFQGDVGEAVLLALSHRVNADGTMGLFHPDNFTFGQAVYLSRLYTAVEKVAGVESAVVTRFHRFGLLPGSELEKGVIPMGPWEIARLDNDPNFQENGVLRLTVRGGK